MGLEGSASDLGIGANNTWAFLSPNLETDLQAYFALDPTPEVLAAHDVPLIFISFPSAKDPTWAERFPNKTTCEIVTVAPWHWFEAHKDKRVEKRGAAYDALKGAIAQRIWSQVQALYPRLQGRAPANLSAASPVSFTHYLKAQKGGTFLECCGGWLALIIIKVIPQPCLQLCMVSTTTSLDLRLRLRLRFDPVPP